MIKVSNAIKVYEVDGEELSGSMFAATTTTITLYGDAANAASPPTVGIHSHWNRNDLVIIEINGKQLTVVAKDLEAAVRNATNSGGV